MRDERGGTRRFLIQDSSLHGVGARSLVVSYDHLDLFLSFPLHNSLSLAWVSLFCLFVSVGRTLPCLCMVQSRTLYSPVLRSPPLSCTNRKSLASSTLTKKKNLPPRSLRVSPFHCALLIESISSVSLQPPSTVQKHVYFRPLQSSNQDRSKNSLCSPLRLLSRSDLDSNGRESDQGESSVSSLHLPSFVLRVVSPLNILPSCLLDSPFIE